MFHHQNYPMNFDRNVVLDILEHSRRVQCSIIGTDFHMHSNLLYGILYGGCTRNTAPERQQNIKCTQQEFETRAPLPPVFCAANVRFL